MVMRQQVWIDNHVQGVLVGRVLIYWSGIMLFLGLSTLCTNWWQYPEWTLSEHIGALIEYVWPYAPTLILLLPLVVFDMVRLSNRFAGPVYRLRMHLKTLESDPRCPKLDFRDDDYWQQLAEPINRLQLRLISLEEQLASLSYLQKTLTDAGVPLNPTPSEAHAKPAPDDQRIVTEVDSIPTYATASSSAIPGDEDMQTIPPIPADSLAAEPFVTLTAN